MKTVMKIVAIALGIFLLVAWTAEGREIGDRTDQSFQGMEYVAGAEHKGHSGTAVINEGNSGQKITDTQEFGKFSFASGDIFLNAVYESDQIAAKPPMDEDPKSANAQMENPVYQLFKGDSGWCSATVISSRFLPKDDKQKKKDSDGPGEPANSKTETLFLTANHCWKDKASMNIRVRTFGAKHKVLSETVYYLKKKSGIKNRDVAILQLTDDEAPLFPVAKVAPKEYKLKLRTPIHAIGFARGREMVRADGNYGGYVKSPFRDGIDIVTGTATLYPGMSGGPVFVKEGEDYLLIGSNVGYYRDTSIQNYYSGLKSVHWILPKKPDENKKQDTGEIWPPDFL